ncbi:MAG: nucleotidyl transferase AbiEii/AbiGii toxin family protein [Chitinophagales bacterium]|nr:nucleotidyl transferase AbiEii/AbiGii toxin family protein [Chitinophagales bacterium]
MLHYNTVSVELLAIIKAVASNDDFNNFRLCGGTALALQKGHRISADADFVAQEIVSADELIGSVLRNFS